MGTLANSEDPDESTMDHPNLFVSNFMENHIGLQRVHITRMRLPGQ